MLLRYFHEGRVTFDLTGTSKDWNDVPDPGMRWLFLLINFRIGPDNMDNNPVKTCLFLVLRIWAKATVDNATDLPSK